MAGPAASHPESHFSSKIDIGTTISNRSPNAKRRPTAPIALKAVAGVGD
jgi:hypothetical protein